MDNQNEHIYDLLPGYALGSLDEEELLQVARHLPGCAACRGELESFLVVVDGLAAAVPLRTPPARVKANLMRRVTEDPRPQTEGLFHRLAQFFSRPAGLAFAGLALLVVLLAAGNLLLWRQYTELQARTTQAKMQVVALGGTTTAPEAHGYMMVFAGENYGTLVVEKAPALQEGQQYQLWLVHDGERQSGGVFSVSRHGYGAVVVYADRPLGEFTSYGVTVEPEGGSEYPTGERILAGGL